MDWLEVPIHTIFRLHAFSMSALTIYGEQGVYASIHALCTVLSVLPKSYSVYGICKHVGDFFCVSLLFHVCMRCFMHDHMTSKANVTDWIHTWVQDVHDPGTHAHQPFNHAHKVTQLCIIFFSSECARYSMRAACRFQEKLCSSLEVKLASLRQILLRGCTLENYHLMWAIHRLLQELHMN